MAVTWVLNLDFEHSLGHPKKPSPKALRNQCRRFAWLAQTFARPGDRLFLPEDQGFDQDSHDRLVELGFPALDPVHDLNQAERIECWGVTDLVKRHDPENHPEVEVVRRVHGKSFAQALAQEHAWDLPRSAALTTEDPVLSVLREDFEGERAWILKRDLSVAGRGALKGRGPELNPAQRDWLAKALRDGPVVLQECLERHLDLSVQGVIDREGAVTMTGFSRMRMRGTTYAGTCFGNWSRHCAGLPSDALPRLAETCLVVGEALQAQGFFGNFGVDALVDQRGRLFPLLEINARRTMAQAAFAFQRFLAENEYGELIASPNPSPGDRPVAADMVLRIGP